MVIQSIRKREMLIVSDCTKEANFYFREDQKCYLKSMVSHPFKLGLNLKELVDAALVIDTDVPGYFKEDDRGFLADCLLGRVDKSWGV